MGPVSAIWARVSAKLAPKLSTNRRGSRAAHAVLYSSYGAIPFYSYSRLTRKAQSRAYDLTLIYSVFGSFERFSGHFGWKLPLFADTGVGVRLGASSSRYR